MDLDYLIQFFYLNHVRAVVIFALFFIVSKVFFYISQRFILKLTRKTKTKVDELIVGKTSKPFSLILILIGIRLAVMPLGLTENITRILNMIVSSFIAVLATYIVILVIDILLDNWGKRWAEKTKSALDTQLLTLLHRFSKILFSILGFLFILDLWGIKIGALLASLGIAGIAVAFALQTTLGNIFGGISMIIDKTIKVGDIIEVDADTMGYVIDIGLRSTKIRTFNNQIITVPNGKLASSRIQNFVHKDPSARVVIQFGVAYGSNIDKVKKVTLKEINQIKGIKKDPEPLVRFVEMADSALLFKAYFWVKSYKDRIPATDDANYRIYNALNKHKINIPFPQMDVHVKKR
ncbi:mechanosensitive ion channel family protein [Candidatus Woesearchaeota archaeon]|nr:mechanosensitive ion channel family protein [Candidatus Woesearchaeota archaeon]